MKQAKNRQTSGLFYFVEPTLAVHSIDLASHSIELFNWRQPTNNRQSIGLARRTTSQSEMTAALRHTSTKTPWWKSCDEEDLSNRNVSAVMYSDKMTLANRRGLIRVPAEHVVDNFRFIDDDRKWVQQNEPNYVEENLKRYVRSCRRSKSLDDDSDDDNDQDGGVRPCDISRDCTPSVNFGSAASEDPSRASDVSRLDYNAVKRRTSSALKRSRSHWSADPLFADRSMEEQRAIDDLLLLDNDEGQSMEADSDHKEEHPVHHSCEHEFLKISNELQHLCVSDDNRQTRANPKPTGIAVPQRSVMMSMTMENQAVDGKYSSGTKECAVQPLNEKSGSDSAVDDSHATLTRTNVKAIGVTERKDPSSDCWNSESVSHPESVFRQDADHDRLKLDEVNSLKSVLGSSVSSILPPLMSTFTSEMPASLRFLKSDLTSNVVSLV